LAATCARAFEPLVDLVLQELGGLVEQVDADQAFGKASDHLVAAPADRGQFAIFVEHAERVDRRDIVALRPKEQLGEQRRRCVLRSPRFRRIGLQPRRRAGRRKCFRKARAVGINLCQHLQGAYLDSIATPDHREQFELTLHFCRRDLAALLLQDHFEQPGFRRRLPIGRVRREAIGIQRVLLVPERLRKPSAQHRSRRIHLFGNADDVELAFAPYGAGIVLHLERSLHRIHRHDALQVRRQGRDREFGVLEFFPRVDPFALTRKGEPLPQLCIVAVADHRVREILHAAIGPPHQDAGDGMDHHHRRFLGAALGLRQDQV